MNTLQQINIFVSSPNDVSEERQIVTRVIQHLNQVQSIANSYHLNPLAYEHIVPAAVGQRPQSTVNRYMMEASQSDLFICILWHRMGTPIIHEEIDEQFQSGTEYEFMDAYRANQKFGKPYILLYRSMKPISPDVDPEQLKQVQAFFERFKGENAGFKGLYKFYNSYEEFEEILFRDIDSIIAKNLIWPHNSANHLISTSNLLREDWGEAPLAGQFYGRERELAELEQWIEGDHCRVVALLGMGGVGKTALSVKLVRQLKERFDYIYWRSLQNAPPLDSMLKNCIQFLSNQQSDGPIEDVDSQMRLLIDYLRKHRCLLVLDNCESVLQEGNQVGQYRRGYEWYGKLIHRIGETEHQSCLLLTSREKPRELARSEGKTSPVRSLQLSGVGQIEGREILEDKSLFGTDAQWAALILLYSGNPLALKLISGLILEVFGGDIATFLQKGAAVFGDIHDLLDQQFQRLSELEQELMYWLAIERQAVSIEALLEDSVRSVPMKELLEALASLRRRSMIETNNTAGFTLQAVIMEYVTNRFITQVFHEIKAGTMKFFASHALIKARTKDYLRDSQMRLILIPLLEQLIATLGKAGTEKKLRYILSNMRELLPVIPNYAAGNGLNLLIQLKVDLQNYDFSHLVIWQAYLQGVSLPNVNFAYADFEKSVFTDTFGSIFSVALSPDGKFLAAGIANGEVRWWQTDTGTALYTGQEHTDWVRSVAFSLDGSIIASGSYDQTIRLWEVRTGKCLKILQGHNGRVYSVAFSFDGGTVVSSSGDQTIRLWEVRTGKCLKILQGHDGGVFSVAFSTDGKTIVSGGEDRTVRLWDVSSGECLRILEGHTSGVWSIAISADGKTIVSGGADQTIRLWEMSTGECFKTLEGHTNRVWSIAISADGRTIVSGGGDQTVRLWEVSTGECIKTLQGHRSWVWSIALSFNGELLATGGEDQTIRLWEVSTGECLRTLQGYNSWVYSVAFSADGKTIASSGGDRTIRLWEVSTGECLRTLQGHNSWVYSVAFSADGKTIASGSEDQTIRLWEVNSGQCIIVLRGHSSWVRSVAFSADGKTIASGSEDQTIRLWEVSSGRCLKTLSGHSNWVRSVAFSADGKTIASGSEDQTIRLWEVSTGRCLIVFQGHSSRIYSVALSPDGKLLASGSGDGTIRLWDVSTGECLKTLQGYNNWIRSVAFSADGKTIASGSVDQTIRLWEVSTGRCLKILHGHSSWVYSVAFSADGRTLVSGSGDGTIKLWDIQEESCLRTLRSERPYEGMNISYVRGLTPAQKAALKALGAIEEEGNTPAHG